MMKLPENPNISWLKKTMSELFLNYDRVTDDMCFKEVFNAYPEYINIAKKVIEESTGPISFYAYKMYKENVVDLEWLKSIIEKDEYSNENNLLYIMNKVKDLDEEINNKFNLIASSKSEKELNVILNNSLGGF